MATLADPTILVTVLVGDGLLEYRLIPLSTITQITGIRESPDPELGVRGARLSLENTVLLVEESMGELIRRIAVAKRDGVGYSHGN